MFLFAFAALGAQAAAGTVSVSYKLNGETVSFSGATLREVNDKMRKYWEVSGDGCAYNAAKLPADRTGTLTWTVSGIVEQGDYLNEGALVLPSLSGGYIYRDGTYQWKKIEVKAAAPGATIISSQTFDVHHSYLSTGTDTTTVTGVTLQGDLYVVPHGTVTFDGCTFTGQLRVPNGDGAFAVTGCTFTGTTAAQDSNGYVMHYQAAGTLAFTGNTVANGYKRGLNIDNKDLTATVEKNKLGTTKDAGRSAIQISTCVKLAVTENEIKLNGGNAITLHENLLTLSAAPEVSISGNTVTGTGYLIYDDAKANDKEFTSDSLKLTYATDNVVAASVDTTKGVKGTTTYGISTAVNNEVQHYVATVGTTGYTTLAAALADVAEGKPLTWVAEGAWPVETPVYYNGTFYETGTGFAAKGALERAIDAANAANAAAVAKIYVRPGFEADELVLQSHQHLKTSLAIYGNDAKLSRSWEPCVEDPGENYHTLTKDVSIEIYNLHDGAGVWGRRVTAFVVTVTMADCKNVHEVLLNGQFATAAASVNNFTIRRCTFDGENGAAECPVTTTSAGKVVVEGCAFANLNDNYVVNMNNKNGGTTEVAVRDCSFTNCGATGKEVVRLTGEAEGSTVVAELDKLTFDEASAANAIIVGNKKTENNKASVSYTITQTSGTMNVYKQGVTTAEATTLDAAVAYSGDNVGTIADEKALRRAFCAAPTDGTVVMVKLGADITLETLYAAENFGTEKLDDNAAGDTFNRYKVGVHPTVEDPDHWNPLVTEQTQEQRLVYGAYYHMAAKDERIARLVVKSGQKIVLDLNGHTIQKNARATHGDWSNVCTDIIGNYGTLEIVDSSTGTKGTIKGIGYISCGGAVLHNYEGATMTVTGVNVDGNAAGMSAGMGQYVVSNEGGTLTLDGVNVYDTATSASLIMSNAGTVTIKNATLNHPAAKVINAKGGVINIESASVTSDKYAVFATGDARVNVNGSLTIEGTGTLKVEGNAATLTKKPGVELSAPAGCTWVENDGVQVLKSFVAKVGETGYLTLAEAFAALSAQNYTLTLLKDAAWNAATPVYWAAGTQRGYTATLTAALTAAYQANAGAITIVCRPGADVGTMTHGHVADDLTIYGNDAYLSDGECDLEVDTYTFSRATGAEATYLDKDIAITAYELDNLGVWGERHTAHKVTVNLTDCDGKALEGKTNVQRVYIVGTTGVNNITLTGCDFLTKATAVYSNADGAVTAVNCSFKGGQVPFNINHQANGTQTVAVENCTFTNCGDNGGWKQFAAPLRLVNSGAGTLSAEVTGCAFEDTVGANGDILLGDGRKDKASNDVELKVVNTAANIQAQKPGYYGGETVDATKKATAASPAKGTLETSIAQLLPVDPRTLGYATSGKAEALPETPNMNDKVVNVTAAQAQYVLDGAYGPIDGKTINFTESINDTLILGRASKYDGSKTIYRHGSSHDGEPLSYADFIAYKNQSGWTESCYYERTVENVTFTANDGVTVKNFEADGGAHIYAGAGTAPVYDYVRDTGLWVTEGSCYFKRAILKNITFKGLTFKAKTDINTSESTTVYDGFTFKDCTFDLGTTVGGNQAIRYYNENNNGNVKNLVVEGCTFKTCFQGVYTAHVKNVTVKGCTFDTTGHNAIAIQDFKGACDHGAVVITGNTFKNIGDRAIRFGVVAAGTTITITGNTATYRDGTAATDKQCIKAETLAEGVTTKVELNNWNNYAVAANKPLMETVAKIGTTDYKSLEDATKAAKDGDVIKIVGYTSNMTAPDGWKFETADGVTTLVADPVLAKGEDGKFHIASYDDLLLFKKMVNEKGMNFTGETVVLDADISCTETWTAAIGTFTGTLDGNGKTISKLKVVSASDHAALFSKIEGATVLGLTISEAEITSASGNYNAVLAAEAVNSTITGVQILSSTVTTAGEYAGAVYGGGYAAVSGCTVDKCAVTGTEQIGGLAGYMWLRSITDCTISETTVTATAQRAGLLVGKMQVAKGNLGASSMSISGNTVDGKVVTPAVAGGLIGQIMGDDPRYEIKDNDIDVVFECAGEKAPIGVLRSSQAVAFTEKISTNITGNWWENATLDANEYTYTNTNGAGDQVVVRGVAQVGTTTYKTLAEALGVANDEGAVCELIADVTLKGNWTPIPNFKGTFDGKNHQITGLNVSGCEYVGLIGVLDGGTVKNVQFASVDVSGGTDAGSAVGRIVNDGTVDNVKVLSGTVKGTKRIGGVVGSIKACGTVKNCENAANVEASTYNVGGIVGAAYYTETGKEMYITNCRNTADITSAGVGAGGIVGLSCANVSGNTNTGAVKGKEVGGIVGEQKTYGSVTGNTNSGAVTNTGTGTDNWGTGGIIGWLRYHGASENSAYPQSAIITVSGNSNSGTITGGNDAGGIVGVVYNSAVITDNRNTAATLSGTTFAAGIVGNYQITETPAAVEPAKNKLTFTGNTSTTTLDNITANNKDLLIYDNREKVAQIGDKKYATLAEAVEAAKIGDTIKVIANDASLSVPEGWTISGSTLIPVDKTWHIANLDQLKEFQSAVNGGNTFDGQTVVLDENIDMASVENWTPVGNASEKKFAGTFDGQNHTISGLKITGGSYVGLFGYLGAATVQNVALVGANVRGVKRVGALVGQIAGNATIKNCSLDATSSVAGSDSNTGGLIGEASGSIVVTLENLTNNAPVTNTESGTSRAAGILCQATSGASVTLKNCVNKGTITTNGGYAGGIVSAKQGGASLVFDGCSNTGTLANGTKGTGALLAWSCNGSSVTISNYSGDVANAIGWLSQDNYDHVFVINGVEHYIRVAKGGSGYTFASRYEAAQPMDKSYLLEIIGFFNYAKTVNANFAGYPATPVEVLKSAYNTRDESIKGGLFNTDTSSGWPQLLSQYNATSGKSLTADDFSVTWGTRDVLFMVGGVVVTDTASAQAALDAATPNTTIIFKAGTYGPLFIRQTLEMSTRREDLDKDGSYPAYLRSFKNLTLVAEEGAEVVSKGITAEAGLFWHATAPASNQAEMNRATSGFISYLALENVTIDGIAFDSSERSAVTLRDNGAVATRGNIMVDGLTIQNCTGRGVVSNKNIHFLAAGAGTNDQNFPGTEKKAFNNLVVKNCILDSYYQPIAFNNATAVLNGLTVTGNTFSNNGNSNVLQLSNKVNSGAFVIENNLFKDLNGRVVRATTSTANWTITGNRLDKPIMYDDSGELDLVKINVMAETVGTAVTESNNDWNPGTLANGTYIANGDPALLPVAKIGDTYYWTLAEAVAAAKIGDTITLLKSSSGNGIVVPSGSNFTVDFAGYTYTVNTDVLAGSNGTKNQAFQLLKDSTITFKNGAIVADNAAVKMLIQNYANLTLEKMTLDAKQGNNSVVYVLSTNNGSTTITDTTITAKVGGVAFDACTFGSYTGNTVTMTGTSVINGAIEVSAANDAPVALHLNAGTINGAIVMAGGSEKAGIVVTKTDAVAIEAPAGYKWDNGALKAIDYVAKIGEVKYETLAAAFDAVKAGETITLLKSCSGNGIVVPSGSNFTVDFAGYTYTVNTDVLAGSNGTKNQAFQLLKDSTITFKNGAIVADNAAVKMLIQNYANLTLEKMTLDAKQGNNSVVYVLSTNNGSTTITDTTITAKVGGVAFDACTFGSYTGNTVTMTGTSVINGAIEVSAANDAPVALHLNAGTINGAIVMAGGSEKAGIVVTKTDAVAIEAPAGYKWVNNALTKKDYVASITDGETTTKYETLQAAFDAAFAAGPSAVEVEILSDITLTDWTPVEFNSYPANMPNSVKIKGNGHVISGLTKPLVGKTWTGTALEFDDLTIRGANIDVADTGSNGVGAFIGYVDSTESITLKNCSVTNSTIKGGHWCGGLIGYCCGYSNTNDGAVFTTVTLENCKVDNTTVMTTTGSAGALIGHATGSAWTKVVVIGDHTTVKGNTIVGENDLKTGVLFGTVGVGQTDATHNKNGGIEIVHATVSDNVTKCGDPATQTDARVFGRIGSTGGTIAIKGGSFSGMVFPAALDITGVYAISGGTFSSEVPEQYCAVGFIPKANSDGTYGVKKVAHVVAITLGDGTKEMPFPITWLAANIGSDESSWTTAALDAKAENGLAKWQCYLFGLDPKKEDAKVIATAGQGTDKAIPLTVANADASPLVTGGYVTVAYVLMGSNDMGSNDGTAWTKVATSDKRDGLAISLTGTTYKFYRVDVKVTSAEGK